VSFTTLRRYINAVLLLLLLFFYFLKLLLLLNTPGGLQSRVHWLEVVEWLEGHLFQVAVFWNKWGRKSKDSVSRDVSSPAVNPDSHG